MADFMVPSDPRTHRYGLGRLHDPDDRDKAFPMQGVLQATDAPKRTTPWRLGPVLNQGESSTCVGHTAAAWLMAEPTRTMSGPDPFHIYRGAQRNDPWKAVEHDGSTIRAALQFLQEGGHIERYLWAFDVPTVLEWLQTQGTVMMGTTWYRSMFRPDEEGIITVEGARVGGHAWLLTWWDEKRGLFKLRNSWGVDWGHYGEARISAEDLDRLLHEDGEACAAVEARRRQRPSASGGAP